MPNELLKAYNPTPRERVLNLLKDYLPEQNAQDVGTVLDFTPVGDVMSAYEIPGAVERAYEHPSMGTIAAAGLTAASLLPFVPNLSRMAQRMAREAPNTAGAFKVFHGSPHDFDAFDSRKIGTGEGAQAYGHGLYFAEDEGIARHYRDALAKSKKLAFKEWDGDQASKIMLDNINNRMMRGKLMSGGSIPDDPVGNLTAQLNEANEKAQQLRENIYRHPEYDTGENFTAAKILLKGHEQQAERIQGLLDWYKANESNLEHRRGRMYEVEIDADPEKDFIDWDTLGRDEQQALKRPQYVEELKAAGKAKGIKYRDANSRQVDPKSGTRRNYVVFDDKITKIIRKYGLLPFAGLPLMENEDGPQGGMIPVSY